MALLITHSLSPPSTLVPAHARARAEMLYGSRRKKEQSFSTRCTEPARCPVICKLGVVARSSLSISLQVARVSCPGPPASLSWVRQTVSSVRFFVFMYVFDTTSTGSQGRTWRLPAYPSPCSDSGFADLPLTLFGAPVSIGETRITVSLLSPRPRTWGTPSRDRTACCRSA
jgi:hypothetical protein